MAITHHGHHLASLQLGNVVFMMDNEAFRTAFLTGRRYYYSDISLEFPERATMLTATDTFSLLTVHDAETGHHHFDAEGIARPVETLGVFLGYATAPLFPETQEEYRHRLVEDARSTIILEPTLLAEKD
jgi:hypothetical protein